MQLESFLEGSARTQDLVGRKRSSDTALQFCHQQGYRPVHIDWGTQNRHDGIVAIRGDWAAVRDDLRTQEAVLKFTENCLIVLGGLSPEIGVVHENGAAVPELRDNLHAGVWLP